MIDILQSYSWKKQQKHSVELDVNDYTECEVSAIRVTITPFGSFVTFVRRFGVVHRRSSSNCNTFRPRAYCFRERKPSSRTHNITLYKFVSIYSHHFTREIEKTTNTKTKRSASTLEKRQCVAKSTKMANSLVHQSRPRTVPGEKLFENRETHLKSESKHIKTERETRDTHFEEEIVQKENILNILKCDR